MKTGEKKKKPVGQPLNEGRDQENIRELHDQVDYYRQERAMLLDLSIAIVQVQDKNDLINVFALKLKEYFYFTHAVVSLINHQEGTYYLLLPDTELLPTCHHLELSPLSGNKYFLADPFIQTISGKETPIAFPLEEIIRQPGIPEFLKINYETGVKQVMLATLKNKMDIIGFIFIYSDQHDPFSASSISIVEAIRPLLSNATANILTNDEIKQKEFLTAKILSLCQHMVMVRNKTDLLQAINEGLKKIIHFTHSVILELDPDGNSYRSFLTDPDSRIKEDGAFASLITQRYPINDGIFNVATASRQALTIDMQSFDMNKAPEWFRINYETGSKEILIKSLYGFGSIKYCLLLFSEKANNFDAKSLQVVERIASQITAAVYNIVANDQLLKREKEKSFLLEFSNEIAAVRTKDDLEQAISNVFRDVLHIKISMLRLIDAEGLFMIPYIYDQQAEYTKEEIFTKLLQEKLSIQSPLIQRVLKSDAPVIFDIAEEQRNGNKGPYIYFWKMAGLKKAYGARLRVGSTNLGTLWLMTNEVNLTILKGICAHISIAISNIQANEKLQAYKQSLENENTHLKEQIKTIFKEGDIVGNGAEMQKVYSMMSLVAPSNSTVLLLGETGTGKELIARAIHNGSSRKDNLMIKVNCAAMPANLIESELFGHEKGSFTGAIEKRIGKFELANHGTLFLDEIGEMPLEMQVKLLRVLQERELERVGGKNTIKVDVRIIAATNRHLEQEVAAGKFRADLYYRLNVFPIVLPPLRERIEDIEPLADFFLARYAKNTGRKVTSISSSVLKALKSYEWPGNVRELEHLMERSVLLSTDNVLKEIQLPVSQRLNLDEAINENPLKSLQDMERHYILETLKRCEGKIGGINGAAQILEIPATTLHSKMKKLHITKADYFQ